MQSSFAKLLETLLNLQRLLEMLLDLQRLLEMLLEMVLFSLNIFLEVTNYMFWGEKIGYSWLYSNLF